LAVNFPAFAELELDFAPAHLLSLPAGYEQILLSICFWAGLAGSVVVFFNASRICGSISLLALLLISYLYPYASAAMNYNLVFALALVALRPPGKTHFHAWPIWLLRGYLVTVYFCSGWVKLIFGNWLSWEPVALKAMTGYYITPFSSWMASNLPETIWIIGAWVVIIFELGAPLLFLYAPLRKTALITGSLLHLVIALMMKDLVFFSLSMMVFYVAFLIPVRKAPPSTDPASSPQTH